MSAVGEFDVDVGAVVVDVGDGGDHSVVDTAPCAGVEVELSAHVAQQDDAVTDLETTATKIEGRSGEVTGFGGVLAGEGVEEFGFGTGAGEEVGGSTGGVSVPPVGNGPVADVVGGVCEDDSIVLGVGVPEGGDVTATELVERGVFPLVVLASVDREFTGAVAERVERGSESAASGDLGKLMVIADEDHLRSGCVGAGDDLVEVDGGAHGCFVDDHDRVRVEVGVPAGSGGW